MKKLFMISALSLSAVFVFVFGAFSPATSAQEAASQVNYSPAYYLQNEQPIDSHNLHHQSFTQDSLNQLDK